MTYASLRYNLFKNYDAYHLEYRNQSLRYFLYE